jgi:hypothetical protein
MNRSIAGSALFALALSGVASAQTTPDTAAAPAPAASARPWSTRGAAVALDMAYRAIGEAQVLGTSSYLDAAKNHYRDAMARYARQDAGAAAEAMAAAALARAAAVEHPAPAPRDLPTPPAVAADPMPGMRPGEMPPMRRGPRGRFDPTRLAADAKLADTAEARDLAQKAVDADVARTRAAYAGNRDEAMRQGRLANDLAMAVRLLARADHPPAFNRRRPTRPAAAANG